MLHACNCIPHSFSEQGATFKRSTSTRLALFAPPIAKGSNVQRDQPLSTVPNGLITKAVSAATGILRLRSRSKLDTPVLPAVRLAPGDIGGVLSLITEDFHDRAYFITGDISDSIYDSACYFADPTVQFSGLTKWKQNLQLLVPFLVNPKIELLDLRQEVSSHQQADNGPRKLKIVSHVESWNISPLEAIKQVFTPGH